MDWTAPHLGYVLGAYAVSAAVLVALVAWIVLRDRRIRRELRETESRRERRP